MRYITFDEIEDREYRIDWDTNHELKYKEPLHGIRVYQTGVVVVSRNGYNDPTWRARALSEFGLDFQLPKDLIGATFFDPNTGAQVRKGEIEPDMLLVHRDSYQTRVYAVGQSYYGGDYGIRFVSEHALPLPGMRLSYSTRNKPLEEARLTAMAEHFAVGETLNAVSEYKTVRRWGRGRGYMSEAVMDYINGIKPLPTDLQDPEVQDFCRYIANARRLVEEAVSKAARTKFNPEYLIMKEK